MLFKKNRYKDIKLEHYEESKYYNPILLKIAHMDEKLMKRLMIIDLQTEILQEHMNLEVEYNFDKAIGYESKCAKAIGFHSDTLLKAPDKNWAHTMGLKYEDYTPEDTWCDLVINEVNDYWNSELSGVKHGIMGNYFSKNKLVKKAVTYLLLNEHYDKEKFLKMKQEIIDFINLHIEETAARVDSLFERLSEKEVFDIAKKGSEVGNVFAKDYKAENYYNFIRSIPELVGFDPDYRLKDILLKYVPERVLTEPEVDFDDFEKVFDFGKW